MARQLTDEEILAYKDKEPTAVQERYADWLIEKLEIEFSNTKAEAQFREAVRLATALRMIFQASPENQEARAAGRENGEEAPAPAAPAKAAKPAKGKTKADPEPEAEAEADNGSQPASKAKAKPGRPKKAAAATPAAAPADDDDNGDTAVAPAAKASGPKKAARGGTRPTAPF